MIRNPGSRLDSRSRVKVLFLLEDRLAPWVKFSYPLVFREDSLVTCVSVSFVLYVRKKQSLCLGPMSVLHILSREDSVADVNGGFHFSFVLRNKLFVGHALHMRF